MTIWGCQTHVRMTSMTSSVEWTDLDFKISVALFQTLWYICFMFDMMIDAGPKFYVVRYPTPYMTLRSRSWT